MEIPKRPPQQGVPANYSPTVIEADKTAADSFAEFLLPEHPLSRYTIAQLAIEFAAHRERALSEQDSLIASDKPKMEIKPMNTERTFDGFCDQWDVTLHERKALIWYLAMLRMRSTLEKLLWR